MPMLTAINRFAHGALRRADRMLGYDAAETTKKRKAPPSNLNTEDKELPPAKRQKLVASARDVHRNFAIAGWMIRKHLDFVSSFGFQSQTADEGFNKELEALIEQAGRAENFDVAKRHSRSRFLRLSEARRTLDGDIYWLKLAECRIQAIEGDRIRVPFGGVPSIGVKASDMTHGVLVTDAGEALAYCVCKRSKSSNTFEFERMIDAKNIIPYGYFDRFDQVRGISPMAAGLNSLRDVYENFDYALAKAKVEQLFALAFYREAVDTNAPVEEEVADDEESEDSEAAPHYSVDFGKGPVVLDLDPGDRAEFLHGNSPSSEFQSFTQSMIGVALKSIDIPYCFYDEAYTNFFGSRAALILYLQSCKAKREDAKELLRRLTNWQIGTMVMDGRLILPASMSVEDIEYDWIPSGLPWWDPAKEISGDVAAVSACLRSRTEIRKERYGDDWKDVVDTIAGEEEYMRSKNVGVVAADAGVYHPAPVVKDKGEE